VSGADVLSKYVSKGHSRTRADHASELTEDYVEAIAEIIQQQGQCRGADLATRFGVSHVTINRSIGRLQRDGFVQTEPYGPVFLTPKGERLARQSQERHAVVMQFLITLGVSEAVAAIDSEGMEHHVSPETLKAMQTFIASRSQ
jgi:DtxR family manganese transport transcriptional regulator